MKRHESGCAGQRALGKDHECLTGAYCGGHGLSTRNTLDGLIASYEQGAHTLQEHAGNQLVE